MLRSMFSWLALLLWATAGNAQVAKQPEPQKRPNILVVLSDDHSVPHVGCYNNPDIRTPHLDALAAKGMRFDRAYVTTPQCVPSRASIMTGRCPISIQMTRFSAPLPRDVITFPEILRAAGYFTGVAGRTYHLDGSALPPESAKVFAEHKLKTFPDRLDYVKTGGTNALALKQFREFLSLVPKGRPFFLQLCSSDPHRPLDRNAIAKPHDPAKLKLPKHYPDTPLVRDDFARYYDEIARFDEMVGEVMRTLEEMGLLENTIILFMGDNGASQLRGKGTLYQFGINVPLIMRWHGHIRPGSTTAELISGEDLAPTLLEAAGCKAPSSMTGKSYLKLLLGQPNEGRKYAMAQRGAHGSGLPNNSAAFDLGRCVVGKRYKLIYNAIPSIPFHPVDFANDAFWKDLIDRHEKGQIPPELDRLYFAKTRPMFELYDLQQDPAEMTNLYGRRELAEIEADLKAVMQEWMILERDFVPLPISPQPKKAKK
jgi:N-sulfoglucosamine sulfohydrolase